MDRVQQLAKLLFGFDRAQEWMESPNVHLNGVSPREACEKGHVELVMQILHSYMPRR